MVTRSVGPSSPPPLPIPHKRKSGPEGPLFGLNSPKEVGAGEGIRTLDPNLGKVVLYP